MLNAKQAFAISINSEEAYEECDSDFMDYVMEQIRDSAQFGQFETLIDISECKDFSVFADIMEGLGYSIINTSYAFVIDKDERKKMEDVKKVISWEDAR